MADAQILIVEDEIIIAMDIQSGLESLGYTVSARVSSGREAIQKTAETRPDLVLMDIKLRGDMDGVEAAEQIRARFGIPVVYLTAYADDETLQRAKITEPFGYILKPFEVRELRNTIEMALYRHEMDKKSRESEEKFRSIFESAYDFLIYLDIFGRILDVNKRALEAIGMLKEEVVGKHFTELNIFPSRELPRVAGAFAKSLIGGPKTLTMSVKGREGQEIPLECSASFVKKHGKIVGVMMIARDITERKRAEETLRESEERYRSLFNNVPLGLYRSTPQGQFLDANPALVEILGYPDRQSLLAVNAIDLYVIPEERQRWQALMETKEVVRDYEGQFRRCDGSLIWLRESARTVRDTDGQVLYYEGILEDITEHKRAEEALQESEERFRTLFDGIPACCWTFDRDGTILDWNRACEELYGWTAEQVAGKTMYDLMVKDENVAPTREKIAAVFQGQSFQAVEYEDVRADGTVCNVLVNEYPLKDARGQVIMGVCAELDITERKRAEKEVRQRTAQLEALREVGLELTAQLDLDALLRSIVSQARELLGGTAGGLALYRPERDVLEATTFVGDAAVPLGSTFRRGEGLSGKIWQTGEPLVVDDYQHWEGRSARYEELPIPVVVGVPVRWGEEFLGTLIVQAGAPRFFSSADVALLNLFATQAAIAIQNARLYEQAQRDAKAKSVLLREVNHRVKNNMAAIIGLLRAARRHAGMEGQSAYQSIMKDLINQVQGLATVHRLLSASEWAPLLLSELTAQVIPSSLQMLPRDKHVSVDVAPSPVRVTPDQAHNLALAINELVTNTVKYALQERDAVHITVHITLDGDTVLFEFRNDGPGYPEEVLQLERHSVGFDLIQDIVHRGLGGELELHNDQGAVAIVRFPAEA